MSTTLITYFLLKCFWCFFLWSGSCFSTWQEAFELGKRQGYEIPHTNTANNKVVAAPAPADGDAATK